MTDLTRLEPITRRLALILVLCLLLLGARTVAAQNYSFSVPDVEMQAFIRPDATVRVVYDITLRNATFASPIDIVDVGMPNADYDIDNMVAAIDGRPLSTIRRSEFVNPGVEVLFGGNAIAAGDEGVFHFEFTMSDLVFQDVTNSELASFQITPTWFDSELVLGTTNLQIAVHLPEGISPNEMLYQEEPFSVTALFQDHAVALWQFPETRFTGPHIVGVSFPKRVMTFVVSKTVWELAVDWFVGNPQVRVIAGIAAFGLFTFLFFRFTGSTGCSLWFILAAGLGWMFVVSPGLHMLSFIPLVPLVFLNERALRKKKDKYLPPLVHAEGGGIKRGLTAAEAAALLELPLNKVLSLILFGLLKKGILRQVEADPLQVELVEAFRVLEMEGKQSQRHAARRKAAQEMGVVLHKYEQPFLDRLEKSAGKPVAEIDLSTPMKSFLQTIARRVKGFNLDETREYYRRIVTRAVTEAQAIGDIPELEKTLDRNLEWILMSDDYSTVFLPRPTYTYFPRWVRTSAGTPVAGGGRSGPGAGGSAPRMVDVTAGFAGWAENTMGSLASTILPGKVAIEGTRGFINLGGVDRATSDVFEALSKSSGGSSGGGGGSSCACACAGCACACACAGGGR